VRVTAGYCALTWDAQSADRGPARPATCDAPAAVVRTRPPIAQDLVAHSFATRGGIAEKGAWRLRSNPLPTTAGSQAERCRPLGTTGMAASFARRKKGAAGTLVPSSATALRSSGCRPTANASQH
jgi:hypothetical protein